jgi:hypothetical protein
MKKKMNFCKNKNKLSTMAIILVLAVSTLITVLPAVSAQAVTTKATVAYLGLMPDPVGVDQEVLLHIGITDYRTSAEDGFEGLTVEVVRPDGETETLGPFKTDSTGGTGWVYVPTMAGTYTFQTIFPEQTWDLPRAAVPTDVTYLASESEIVTLTVQEKKTQFNTILLTPFQANTGQDQLIHNFVNGVQSQQVGSVTLTTCMLHTMTKHPMHHTFFGQKN